MNLPDSSANFAGSDASTPNCNIAFDNTSTDCAASNPAAFANKLTDSLTLPNASGVLAKSGPNLDNTVWNASNWVVAEPPNCNAKSCARVPKSDKPSPVTPVTADTLCNAVSNFVPDSIA